MKKLNNLYIQIIYNKIKQGVKIQKNYFFTS